MSLSPKDMDFIEAKHAAAREIALAFGVPPMLLGIPGDNTYANYQEANRAFWRSTVLPLASRIGAALAQWLAPAFGDERAARGRYRPDRGAVGRPRRAVGARDGGAVPHAEREAGRGRLRAGRGRRPARVTAHYCFVISVQDATRPFGARFM